MRILVLAPIVVMAACQTYEPEPLDLAGHARAFAARLPDPLDLQPSTIGDEESGTGAAAGKAFDLADGLDLSEARYIALFVHPALRVARAEVAIAKAAAETAGLWEDPQLSGSFFYVLERTWQYDWFAGGYLAQTLPVTGMPGLEKALAGTQHELALVAARTAETGVLDRLDAAWVELARAKQEAVLAEQLVIRLRELEQVADALVASGELMHLEARAFELARMRAEVDALTAAAGAERARLVVHDAIGLPPSASVELDASEMPAERVARDDREVALLDGPSVRTAKLAHDVAERTLQREIRKQWPELWVQPGWQEEDAQPRPALGFSLPLPLWNANARGIAEARASRTAAAEGAKERLERSVYQLARAELDLRTAASRRQSLAEQLLPRTEQQLSEVKRLGELGQLDALLALDAVTRAFEARRAVIDASAAESLALVAVNSLFWPVLEPVAPE